MDMDKEKLKEEYDSKAEIYEALEQEAKFVVSTILDKNKIKIHLILSRVKNFESFFDKIERKKINDQNKEIKEPFAVINDIVGLRVVCLFLFDIEQIANLIKSSFDVINVDNKIDGFDNPASFGYMSLHFVVKMKKEYTGPRYDKIRDIPFEIQVRTISMDAWANISHYLSYKADTDIPKDLKRDFNALSGLFYVADTHFEIFYKQSKKTQQNIEDQLKLSMEDANKTIDIEINLDSLRAYLFSKFPDRKHFDDKAISELIIELNQFGINRISQLEEMYNLAWDICLLEEQEYPPGDGNIYADVGVIRGLLALTNKEYVQFKYPSLGSRYKKYQKMMDDKINKVKQGEF
jgi:ppGpp synthetase/RelA/SpoT-type nucleotidyltranferase